MTITGTDLGKKFEGHWIFQGISVDIHSGEKVAITGPNGSGKSTLLQILTSALTPSTGKLEYHHGDFFIPEEEARHHINFCSPYSNLVEEFTLVEYLKFHGKFKAPLLEYDEMTDRMELSNHLRKPIGQFSSGMKQRVKLSLQFFYEGAILALDEPTNNLDEKGHAWYRSEIISQSESRTILVASNHRSEYEFCTKTIDLSKA